MTSRFGVSYKLSDKVCSQTWQWRGPHHICTSEISKKQKKYSSIIPFQSVCSTTRFSIVHGRHKLQAVYIWAVYILSQFCSSYTGVWPLGAGFRTWIRVNDPQGVWLPKTFLAVVYRDQKSHLSVRRSEGSQVSDRRGMNRDKFLARPIILCTAFSDLFKFAI